MMSKRRTRLRGRLTGRLQGEDRGAVALEAAIVLPIVLLLIVGIIEFGLAFKDELSITSAVRAGARIASAEPRYASFATDAASQVAKEGAAIDMSDVQALWVYQADSSGHPMNSGGTFDTCSSNCVQFTWSAGTKQFVQSGGDWPATSQNACPGQEDSVGVYLKFNHLGVTDVIFDTLGLHSYTVMRLEPIPALQSGGCQ